VVRNNGIRGRRSDCRVIKETTSIYPRYTPTAARTRQRISNILYSQTWFTICWKSPIVCEMVPMTIYGKKIQVRNRRWSRYTRYILRQLRFRAVPKRSSKVFVAATGLVRKAPCRSPTLHAVHGRRSLELRFLYASVAEKGSQHYSVGNNGRCDNLRRGKYRSKLLYAFSSDDKWYSSASDNDENNGEGEKGGKGKLPLKRHHRPEDDGNREGDKQDVCNNIGNPHGKELCVALSALRSWIRDNLPVLPERVAFCQCSNEYSNEGDEEEYANATQAPFVTLLPEAFGQTFEKFGYSELGHPYAMSV
jgi:hypothetical protein